jgi:hypothetical protein
MEELGAVESQQPAPQPALIGLEIVALLSVFEDPPEDGRQVFRRDRIQ